MEFFCISIHITHGIRNNSKVSRIVLVLAISGDFTKISAPAASKFHLFQHIWMTKITVYFTNFVEERNHFLSTVKKMRTEDNRKVHIGVRNKDSTSRKM